MKKSFLTALCVSAALGLYAQGIAFGLKGGLNFANQNLKLSASSLSFSPTTKSLTGFHVGGYLTINFTDKIGLQPEVLYSAVGSKIDDATIGTGTEKASYITIPVLLKINPIPILNIHVGPQIGLLTSATEELGGDSEDAKDQYKSSDIGLAFGAGLDLPMGLNFTARYVLGLGNVAEQTDPTVDVTAKNSVLQISLGYRIFGVKK